MDTNKSEELLGRFEKEVANIAEISSLKEELDKLRVDLNSCSVDIKGAATRVEKSSEDLKYKINEFSNLIAGFDKKIDSIGQNVEALLHQAITRYETYLRAEISLLKDQLGLEIKELKKEQLHYSQEIKTLVGQQSKKTFDLILVMFLSMLVLALLFWVYGLPRFQ